MEFAYSNEPYIADEWSMLNSLEYDEYASLIREVNQNRILDVTSPTYEECYAVVDYFEAAIFYKAYGKTGREQDAAVQKQAMEESMTRMGELEYLAQRIDTMFKIREHE